MPTLSKPATPREALRKARRAVGWTQQQLAEAADCTTATISDLENGRNHQPSHEKSMHIFQALCDAGLMNVTIGELFPVSEIPSRQKRKRGNQWTRSASPRI
jgi:transcriptional regulator with XRE-family HTH domain